MSNCTVSNCTAAVAAHEGGSAEVLLLVITSLEMLGLMYGYLNKKCTWEALWVLSLETFAYGCSVFSPEAPFRELVLANGKELPWLRFVGWLLTCPVLLMGIVSLTTAGGRPPAVQMVPLLVANLTMILLGISAAAIDDSNSVRNLVYGFALAGGGVVFVSAAHCFLSLHSHVRILHVADDPRLVTRALRVFYAYAGTFFAGWLLFPIGFTLGPLYSGVISEEDETLIFVVGDLLSKNSFVAAGVLFRHFLLKLLAAKPAATATKRGISDVEDGRMPPRRASHIIAEELMKGMSEAAPASEGGDPVWHVPVTPATSDATSEATPARDDPTEMLQMARCHGCTSTASSASSASADGQPDASLTMVQPSVGWTLKRRSPAPSRYSPLAERDTSTSPLAARRSVSHSNDRTGAPQRGAEAAAARPPAPSPLPRAQSVGANAPRNAPAPSSGPPEPPRRQSRGWVSPCSTGVARTQPSEAAEAAPPPASAGAVPPSGTPTETATAAAGGGSGSVAIAAAIAAALTDLDARGEGRGDTPEDQLSNALRYIAQNPSAVMDAAAPTLAC